MPGKVVQPADRSSLSVLPYAACDDHYRVRFGRLRGYAESFSLQHRFEDFRIECVHLAAEAFEVDVLQVHGPTLPYSLPLE